MRAYPGLLVLALFVPACTVGDTGNPGGSPDAGAPAVDADLNGSAEIKGSIGENSAWGGMVTLTENATIEPGVLVTVAPGTVFQGAQGTTLTVHGTLQVEGTAAAPVTMNPIEGDGGWGGILVEAGGSVSLSHATGTKVATLVSCKAGAAQCAMDSLEFTDLGIAMTAASVATISKSSFRNLANGGISVSGNGDLTVTDTYIWTSTHDLVVASGGRLIIDHSEIGGAQQSYEHCDLHISAASELRITNSNIVSAVYGMMIGGTTNAVIQYNNFMENDPGQDVDPVGANTGVDLRFNYWDQGAPTIGPDYDTSSPAATAYAEAGPRP
ncbi:MAG TPA: right-handed parallel beta-helix repeat-containing protein [Kofleriaceae bacterium]|nr:right-handed parallel beta-helix repeat-containing protein [Kofleriaceae bacterium]